MYDTKLLGVNLVAILIKYEIKIHQPSLKIVPQENTLKSVTQ